MEPMVYSYSRISSTKQILGTGLDIQQEQEILEDIGNKYNLPVSCDSYSDVASAYHGKHLKGELGKFLAAINDGRIAPNSIIVVYSLDRLSRLQLGFAKQIYLDLTNKGIRIYSILDNHLYTAHNAADDIVSTIVFERSHNESSTKANRARDAAMQRINKFINGDMHISGNPYWIGVGKPPIWCSINTKDKTVEVNSRFNEIRDAVELSLIGYGANQTIQILNNKYGSNWRNDAITKVLNSVALMGVLNINIGDREFSIPDYYPAICTKEEYHRLRQIKTSKTHKRGGAKFLPLLVGNNLVRHKQCMHGIRASRTGNGTVSYSCLNRCMGGSCIGFNINSKIIEAALFNLVLSLDIKQVTENTLDELLITKQEQLQELIKLFDNGHLPVAMISRMGTIEDEIKELSNKILSDSYGYSFNSGLSQIKEYSINDVLNTDNSPNRSKLRLLLADVIDSVLLDKVTGSRSFSLEVSLKDGRVINACYDGKGQLLESSMGRA